MGRYSIAMKGFVLFCLLAVIAEAEYLKYKDPKLPMGARIRDLMKRMSLEKKIGQMIQIEREVASADVMKQYFIGSVLSGGGSVPAPKPSAEDWINMVNEIQKGALSTPLGNPMIYGIDAVHGHNNVYNATIFPHNIGLGVTRQMHDRDPDLVKRIGAATALEVRVTGIPHAFAPCIAVCRDPRWGRCYESYSEDHKIVRTTTEIIPGLQGDLPANALAREHPLLLESTSNGLFGIHMPAYYDSIIKGVSTVMVSYSSWNGEKMHANQDLVTGFLKNRLNFRVRMIISAHSESIGKALTGLRAHLMLITLKFDLEFLFIQMTVLVTLYDMFHLCCRLWYQRTTEFIDALTLLVKNNVIPISRIDDAVKRILRVKFTMGLFENPLADLSLVNQLGSQEHRELAREAVRKSLVLLKNGKSTSQPLLPLPKKAPKILVAGTHADNLGEVPYAEMFGDSSNLTITEPGPSTINNVCGAVKCVVVVVSGRPVVLEPYVNKIDALVAAWLPGTEGQGVADALFGDYGFTGKLARTWFKSVDQLPMNVGDRHYNPLFPFGFGLTTQPVKMN
ncbi:hypothetical protein RND71_010129 [Anisodus tanguticus]|uniref:beta-glucosidase n=1 Tax=Anisodus tanguticus TaxID=243964 RepID=A0AAE1SJA8_9SOLA|nr:hypothetical protein RND71_010129 [Anisodus tanguticus]